MLQVGEEEAVPLPDNRFDIHKTLMAAILFPTLFVSNVCTNLKAFQFKAER